MYTEVPGDRGWVAVNLGGGDSRFALSTVYDDRCLTVLAGRNRNVIIVIVSDATNRFAYVFFRHPATEMKEETARGGATERPGNKF